MSSMKKLPELSTKISIIQTEDSVKLSIIASATDFINEYEKYNVEDYSKLIETVNNYAKNLLEKNEYLKAYKVTRSKIHLNKGIFLRSLTNKGEITEEECSLHILDFIDEFKTI